MLAFINSSRVAFADPSSVTVTVPVSVTHPGHGPGHATRRPGCRGRPMEPPGVPPRRSRRTSSPEESPRFLCDEYRHGHCPPIPGKTYERQHWYVLTCHPLPGFLASLQVTRQYVAAILQRYCPNPAFSPVLYGAGEKTGLTGECRFTSPETGRSTRPGRRPVCRPWSRTIFPFTMTYSMPSLY